MKNRSVAIIGAGFSGLMVAYHLSKQNIDQIYLIDPCEQPGEGLAYSTKNRSHLLNVPAKGMGAFSDKPGDFLEWLTKNGEHFNPEEFVPRSLYAQYLRGIWEQIKERVTHIRARAVTTDRSLKLQLSNHNTLAVSALVLATGNNPPAPFEGTLPAWSYDVDPSRLKRVCIIGTGLTGIDCIIDLESRGFRGSYLMISRRALLPLPHAERLQPGPSKAPYPTSLKDLLSFLRRESETTPWREVIDGFRPSIQDTWRALTLADKRAFLRHLRPFWDIHRHRIPPQVHALLNELKSHGRLTVRKGRHNSIFVQDFDLTVNCSGPEAALHTRVPQFLSSLFEAGLAERDELSMGVKVDQNLRLESSSDQNVYALGALLVGSLWESIAVPELRRQAEIVSRGVTMSFRE